MVSFVSRPQGASSGASVLQPANPFSVAEPMLKPADILTGLIPRLIPELIPLSDQERSQWCDRTLPANPLFGTDGIRGCVGELLTAALALKVGFWTGQILRQQVLRPQAQQFDPADGTAAACEVHIGPVIIGQDSRSSSDMLAMALAAGLTAAGVDVWNVGLCPTPGVAYLVSTTHAIGGVMISASHNPPQDNGLKIFGAAGTKIPKALQQDIEQGIRGAHAVFSPVVQLGRSEHRPELIEAYVLSLRESLSVDSLQGLKIVLDLAWGASAVLAPMVFRALGAELICLHDRPDGQQINVNCGSTHLHRLQEAVRGHGADLGFAFDGDADRVLAVDHQGQVVDGDYILYLWGSHLRELGQLPGNTIVTTVMANLGFERAWQATGGQFVRTAVGDQHVQAEMDGLGAMLGGEQSGHILCRHYGLTGDGLLTALHLAELLQTSGSSLADLVAGSFKTYPQLLRNVRVEDRDQRLHWQKCAPLMAAIASAEAEMGDRGRILVRPSGTEPLIRVMVEAEDAERVEYWTGHLAEAVEVHLVGRS